MALSAMKKTNGDDDGLLRNGRPILNLKKTDTLGTEYNLLSGPSGTKVRVYKHAPEVHEVHVPGKGKMIMSKKQIKEYVSSSNLGGKALTEDMSLTEVQRRSNIEKAQQEDVKKLKSNK